MGRRGGTAGRRVGGVGRAPNRGRGASNRGCVGCSRRVVALQFREPGLRVRIRTDVGVGAVGPPPQRGKFVFGRGLGVHGATVHLGGWGGKACLCIPFVAFSSRMEVRFVPPGPSQQAGVRRRPPEVRVTGRCAAPPCSPPSRVAQAGRPSAQTANSCDSTGPKTASRSPGTRRAYLDPGPGEPRPVMAATSRRHSPHSDPGVTH